MAKGYGLTGKIQGKLGSKVYRIEAGEQIISEYNPNKQDPKSDKQVKQRSKIALANQISRQFPWEYIAGLSKNRTKARNDLFGIIVSNTTAVMDGEQKAVATCDLSALRFSNGGSVLVDSFSINQIAERGTRCNAQLTFNENAGVARYMLLCLPVRDAPNPQVGPFEASFMGMSEEVVPGTVTRASAVMNYSALVTGYHVQCYAIPIIPNTLKKRVIYNEVLQAGDNADITSEALIELARADLYGATIYLGQLVF